MAAAEFVDDEVLKNQRQTLKKPKKNTKEKT